MKRSKFTDEQILAIVKEGEAGRKVADLCRTHGITEQTYYLSLESQIWRHGTERDAAPQAARGRKSALEADRRGADAGYPGVEGGGRKKMVSPTLGARQWGGCRRAARVCDGPVGSSG